MVEHPKRYGDTNKFQQICVLANYKTITIPGTGADQVLISAVAIQNPYSTRNSDIKKALLYLQGFFQNNYAGANKLVVTDTENKWQVKMDSGSYRNPDPNNQEANNSFAVAAENDTLPFTKTFDVTTEFQENVDGDLSVQLAEAESQNGSYDLIITDAVIILLLNA